MGSICQQLGIHTIYASSLDPYPSSKLLSAPSALPALISRWRWSLPLNTERRQNRKIVPKREFSLIRAKHETETILLHFDIIHDARRDVIEAVNLLCVGEGNKQVEEVR